MTNDARGCLDEGKDDVDYQTKVNRQQAFLISLVGHG